MLVRMFDISIKAAVPKEPVTEPATPSINDDEQLLERTAALSASFLLHNPFEYMFPMAKAPEGAPPKRPKIQLGISDSGSPDRTEMRYVNLFENVRCADVSEMIFDNTM